MILFCGIPSEAPIRFSIEAAAEAGIEYAVLNQRHSHSTEMNWQLDNGKIAGTLSIEGADYPLDRFTGVYLRLMEWQHLPENQPVSNIAPDPLLVEKSRRLHEALVEWAEIAPCRVLNRLNATSSNVSKPYQARLIKNCGFQIPPTLVTNDPQSVREFQSAHRRVIYKSISSVRSIVRELSAVELLNLGKVRYLPTQFQAFIPGVNIRVHVVGTRVFATRIESAAVDYRYAGRDGETAAMTATELPDTIRKRCIQLSQALDLPLCGIDLKLTPDGTYYCFEVNPSPAYTYYQERTGQPISQAIVEWLAHSGGAEIKPKA